MQLSKGNDSGVEGDEKICGSAFLVGQVAEGMVLQGSQVIDFCGV